MESTIIAGAITFFFTALLTVSGVGAAFILIPVFIALGVEVHQAMATALLLNAVAMAFASIRFIKKDLVVWRVAIPMALFGSITAPFCAFVTYYVQRGMLLWFFALFCIITGSIMFKKEPIKLSVPEKQEKNLWRGIGFMSGTGGGFLGVGGGNLLVAMLIIFGFDPKKSSASTSFIIIFVCLAAFAGHMTALLLGYEHTGVAPYRLIGICGALALAGGIAGSWLLTDKLSALQVKRVVGVVLILIAAKVIYDLVI